MLVPLSQRDSGYWILKPHTAEGTRGQGTCCSAGMRVRVRGKDVGKRVCSGFKEKEARVEPGSFPPHPTPAPLATGIWTECYNQRVTGHRLSSWVCQPQQPAIYGWIILPGGHCASLDGEWRARPLPTGCQEYLAFKMVTVEKVPSHRQMYRK